MKELFLAALDLAPSERAAFVGQQCAGDSEFELEVMSLIRHHEADQSFLDQPAPLSSRRQPSGEIIAPIIPERIGGYLILDRLGYGSSGVVYLAEQDHTRQRVALKLLRSDARSEDGERFHREATLLGRLTHPGIARVIQAGIADTEVGRQPFLAMEFIAGRPITEHAQTQQLSVPDRVALFLQGCEAVSYAHVRGILHRDLKPDHLLTDTTGRVHVLDFGIARALDSKPLTDGGHVFGTLAYLSPEALRGERGGVLSDLYSLGVILFQLLTGRMPIPVDDLPLPQALHAAGHNDPPSLRDIDPRLSRDLEAIVCCCLEKDPQRRYASVSALCQDLRRFLDRHPVQARPLRPWSRAGRWVLRHRGPSLAAATVVLALGVGLSVALHGLAEARRNYERALFVGEAALRLAQLRRVEEMDPEVDDLWPATSDRAPELRKWLEEADSMGRSLPDLRSMVEQLRDLQRAGLLQETLPSINKVPGGAESLLEQHELLVRRLDAMLDPEHGSRARVLRMLAHAETVREQTLEHHAERWAEVVAAVADPVRSPHYQGLRMVPQEGLVPLGPDPDSGLQEFAVWSLSGPVPERDPATDRLVLQENSALVLVLIPGGTVRIGADGEDPRSARHDPWAKPHEGPSFEVQLSPYFLSKFEMTQAQWVACAGSNPSYWVPGEVCEGLPTSARFPVENVGRNTALDVLLRMGLTLPTEAQWEHAARGGTDTPWWAGRHAADLVGLGNLAPSPELERAFPSPADRALLDDEHGGQAPTGSYRANPFGVHDLAGNVWEWCLDVYKVDYCTLPHRPGDGLVEAVWDGDCSIRGGSHSQDHLRARSAHRGDYPAKHGHQAIGIRPARRLQTPGDPRLALPCPWPPDGPHAR